MSARNMAKRTAAGTLALAVCLGGGAIALAGAANADSNFKFSSRIQGSDRYGTAIEASKAAFKDGAAQNVVLVNGYATVDGLTASYLAGVAKAPILYVSDQGADAATKAEIKRLGAKNIWLVGGTKVIPQSVEDAIKGDGYSVTRINGSDRYETAKLIAEAGAKITGKQPSKVFVASGTSFADALAVSPIAYAQGYAIALTEKDSTSDFTKKELGNIGTDNKILVGGTAVVSDKVAADLSIKSDARIAGDDRAVTANKIADWANASEGFNPANAALVGGTNGNGADSLVAASVLGNAKTALHFAGWDATSVWFKDHAAQLTGAGVVFGGQAAVSDSQVATVQTAAQTVAAATNYLVTDVTNKAAATPSFVYADPAAKAGATAAIQATGAYFIDGNTATYAAFISALTTGDLVSWSTAGGVTTYKLTNVKVMSGLVGSFSSPNIGIIDPITGSTIASFSDSPTAGAWTVNGTAVSKANFELAINPGDSIVITGTGADTSNVRTFALTTGSVTGSLVSTSGTWSTGASLGFVVKTAAGGNISLSSVATNAGDSFKLNGVSVTKATWDAFAGASAGDAFTYSKANGIQSFTLVDAAPASVSGVIAYGDGGSNSTGTAKAVWYDATGAAQVVTYASLTTPTYKVNGSTATKDDFVAAAVPGAWVTYQASDTATNTAAVLSVTSKPLTGTVASANSSATTLNVVDANNKVLASALNYTTANGLFSTGATQVYTVDGTTVNTAQFNTAINQLQTGARLGTITVSLSGTVVTYALSTTINTAAPVIASVVNSRGGPTSTITFNKPISASATLVSTDFTLTQTVTSGGADDSANKPTFSAANVNGAGQIVITYSAPGAGVMPTTSTLQVTLTEAGAAKIADARGVLATAGTNASAVIGS